MPLLSLNIFRFGKQLLFIKSMSFMLQAIGLLFLNGFINTFKFLNFNFKYGKNK